MLSIKKVTKILNDYQVWFNCVGMFFLTLVSIFIMMKGNEIAVNNQKIEDEINSPKFITYQQYYSVQPNYKGKEPQIKGYTRYYIKNIGGNIKNVECKVIPYIYISDNNYTYDLSSNPVLIPMRNYINYSNSLSNILYDNYHNHNNTLVDVCHVNDNEIMFSTSIYLTDEKTSSLSKLKHLVSAQYKKSYPSSLDYPHFRIIFLCNISYYNYRNNHILEDYVIDFDNLNKLNSEDKKVFNFTERLDKYKDITLREIASFPYALQDDDGKYDGLEEVFDDFSNYIVNNFNKYMKNKKKIKGIRH